MEGKEAKREQRRLCDNTLANAVRVVSGIEALLTSGTTEQRLRDLLDAARHTQYAAEDARRAAMQTDEKESK